MIRLALKMLMGDRGKYWMLLSGVTFSTLLMTQQSSVFCGIMMWTTGTIRNVRAPIWVVDKTVEQVNEIKALRDTDVGRVRSVEGVLWAMPLFSGLVLTKLADGSFKFVQLIGLDATTMVGRPAQMIQGRIEDLRLPNTVVIDTLGVERLSAGRAETIKIGDIFEINDHEARVVGICKTERSFTGTPYVFSTYQQALEYAPKTRKMLSFVIAEPSPSKTAKEVAQQIEKETDLKAFTKEDFFWATIHWYFKNTGIPVSFGTTIILGFVVGVAVCGQTFYSFILDNLRHLGAFKAMGASNGLLTLMVTAQALTVGFLGYGCGLGLASIFGFSVLKKGQPPFYMPYHLIFITLIAIFLICLFAALLGIRKIRQLEPAIVFRG